MTGGMARWLIDVCLPHDGYEGVDAVHATDLNRVPGPAGLQEAWTSDRTLVTCGPAFLGPFAPALDHPGVVVFETPPADGNEVARNLRHLEFRIHQYEGLLELAGNRFLIKCDREVYQIAPDGREREIGPWREVRVREAVAAGV